MQKNQKIMNFTPKMSYIVFLAIGRFALKLWCRV